MILSYVPTELGFCLYRRWSRSHKYLHNQDLVLQGSPFQPLYLAGVPFVYFEASLPQAPNSRKMTGPAGTGTIAQKRSPSLPTKPETAWIRPTTTPTIPMENCRFSHRRRFCVMDRTARFFSLFFHPPIANLAHPPPQYTWHKLSASPCHTSQFSSPLD